MTSAPHLSSLTLDALALDALPPPERSAASAHLDGCRLCRARAEEMAALRADFTRAVLPATAPTLRPASPWRFGWRQAFPALAGAAVAVLLLVLVRPQARVGDDGEPSYSAKGGEVLQLFAHRGERTWKVEPGEALSPGDQVRFRVDTGGLPYLLLVSVDGAGQVSTYYPFGGGSSARLPGSELVELPGSVVLDNAPGPERLFALFSREPLSVDSIAPALREVALEGSSAIRARTRLPVAAEAQASFLFEKPQP